MNPSLPDAQPVPNDFELLDRVRAGDLDSFAVLYERHRTSALRVATSLTGPGRADDLVADAFVKILRLLLAGRGPDRAFGAYLGTAVRNAFHDRYRKDRKELLVDDLADLEHSVAPGGPRSDPEEGRLVLGAIASLPERWQQILRLSTIEQRPLEEVATIMGISANAAAQLAYRAREALRVAYLAQHARVPETEACERVIPILARDARRNSVTRGNKVDAHLNQCSSCRSAGAEIARVAATIR